MNGTAATTAMIGTGVKDKGLGFPFLLLIVTTVFSHLRPDRLLPGGEFLKYFPVLTTFILGLCWLASSGKVLHNRQTRYILWFVVLIVIQVPFARHRGLAFAALKSFALFTVTSYLFKVQFIDTLGKWDKYVRISIFLSPFMAFVGIINQGVVKIPALRDENDFALLMNTLVPVAFFLGQEAKSGSRKAFYYGCALLFAVGSIVSFSRGGFIGLAVVGIYLLYKTPFKVTGSIVVLALGLGIYAYAPESYWQEVETIQSKNYEAGTGKERIETWKAGWKMFIDHPITGVGAMNFGVWLPEYYGNNPNKMWGRVAHSLYFTVIPETGIIGVLLCLGILMQNGKSYNFMAKLESEKGNMLENSSLPQQKREEISEGIRKLYFISLAYRGALIAFLATGVFISVFWYSYFWSITAAFVVTVNLGKKLEDEITSHQSDGVGKDCQK